MNKEIQFKVDDNFRGILIRVKNMLNSTIS